MSNNQAVNIECYGTVQRIPLPTPFTTIDKLKSIVRSRLDIDYSFNLTYEGARLHSEDTLHDLALNPNYYIRVRRCSVNNSYTIDSTTDIFLSYEQTHRHIVKQLKQKLEEKNYFCWLDVEEMPDNNDLFCPAIEKGIHKSTVFVCCITNRYVRSTKCRQELSFAKQRDKPIILLMMEDLHWPPQQLGTLVSDLSYIEFYNTAPSGDSTLWPSDKFDELLSKVADVAPQM